MKEMKEDVKTKIAELIKRGHTQAKFAFEPNARLFAGLLDAKGLVAKIYKFEGHANVIEHITKKLTHHFHVQGEHDTAKRLLNRML